MWWERGILVVWWFRGLRGVVPRPGSELLGCFSMCMEGAPQIPGGARWRPGSQRRAGSSWLYGGGSGSTGLRKERMIFFSLHWCLSIWHGRCVEKERCVNRFGEDQWHGSELGCAPSHRSPPNQFARGSPVGHLPVQTGKGTVKWEGNYAGKSGDPLSRT